MMNYDDVNTEQVNFQTQSRQYPNPFANFVIESQPKVSTQPLSSSNGTLQIPQMKVEVILKIPKGLLHQNTASTKVAHTYSIVDDLAQSPAAMSTLEVLRMCPSKWKALLSSLGVMDPQDNQMIFFHAEKSKNPPLPSSISFQILISIRNAIVQ